MGELTINEKRKIIRREFKQFNQENGFRFIRPNTLLREPTVPAIQDKSGVYQLRNRIPAPIHSGLGLQPQHIHRDSVFGQENKNEMGSLRQD